MYSRGSLSEAVIKMTKALLGCVGVLDYKEYLIGIFLDGDLRRSFIKVNRDKSINELIRSNLFKVDPGALLAGLLKIENYIPSIFICLKSKPGGFVRLHAHLKSEFL